MLPATTTASLMTVEAYLAFERASEVRHVYLDGVVTAMAGESRNHADVSMNVGAMLHAQLRGKPCRPWMKDSRIRSGPAGSAARRSTTGMYSYPDVVVVCGEPEADPADDMTTVNPTVVIEVLSPSTAAFDRGEKLRRYRRWNPTLTDYLLVSQDEPWVEQHAKSVRGAWRRTDHRGLDAVVPLPTIGCTLPLAEVYDRVRFPAA